jgi:hypothetical protein
MDRVVLVVFVLIEPCALDVEAGVFFFVAFWDAQAAQKTPMTAATLL